KAYERADTEAADDVAIARTAGLSVAIVNGDEANFKITTQDDLARAKRYLMDLRS
ncbi:MAG: 2-C-methyl-D-erythritol 4-phosphate cytidylyltransferase, partial [Pseudomonadota bacterium]